MRRMRSANSRAMPGRLAGPPQQHRVVVDAEQELVVGGPHAQVLRPRLDPRGQVVVAVAPDCAGDAAHGLVGRLASRERAAMAGSRRPIVPSAESIHSSCVSAYACTSRRVSARSEDVKTIVSMSGWG